MLSVQPMHLPLRDQSPEPKAETSELMEPREKDAEKETRELTIPERRRRRHTARCERAPPRDG